LSDAGKKFQRIRKEKRVLTSEQRAEKDAGSNEESKGRKYFQRGISAGRRTPILHRELIGGSDPKKTRIRGK